MRQAIDAAARLARTQCDRRLLTTWRYSKQIEATAAARVSGKTFLARLRNLISSRGIDAAPTIDAVARAGAARPTPGENLALLEINCSDRRAARVWKNLFSRDPLGEGEKKTNAAAGKHAQIVAFCRIFDAMSLFGFFPSRVSSIWRLIPLPVRLPVGIRSLRPVKTAIATSQSSDQTYV
jgi:hypothetical protein